MQKKYQFELNRVESARFAAMAERLRLSKEESASQIIMAAVEALEGEKRLLWPLYLVQAGTKHIDENL